MNLGKDDDIIDVQPIGEPTAVYPADVGTLRIWGWVSYVLLLWCRVASGGRYCSFLRWRLICFTAPVHKVLGKPVMCSGVCGR